MPNALGGLEMEPALGAAVINTSQRRRRPRSFGNSDLGPWGSSQTLLEAYSRCDDHLIPMTEEMNPLLTAMH